MKLPRLPPLAIAFALMAAGLVATTWATRRAVVAAFTGVREGQAVAIEQAVRADLADLDLQGPPGPDEVTALLAEHAKEGVRYLALVDNRGHTMAEAGKPVTPVQAHEHRAMEITRVGDRLRVEIRVNFRRAWGGSGPKGWWIVMEIEPLEANELREAATRTVAIGALAALTLLGVSIALVRRELRRKAEERDRERERRLASLGEMSAVLAHEIKNPLASLKGNAQLLAAALPPGEKQRAKADRVVDEAVRLEKLTQDLLAFVRTGQLARAPVSPAAIVREAAAAVDPSGAIAIDDGGAPAVWSLDAARLREVIVNLLDNAREAGPPVQIRVVGHAGRLWFEICDHGPGVPAADRDKIFEPFFTGKTRGTGLGLAIAKRMVELHRGTITVDDAPGGGARFRIEIPEA